MRAPARTAAAAITVVLVLGGCGGTTTSSRQLVTRNLDKLYFDYHAIPQAVDPVIRDVARHVADSKVLADAQQARRSLGFPAGDLRSGRNLSTGPDARLEQNAATAAVGLFADALALAHADRARNGLAGSQLQAIIGADRARWNTAVSGLWQIHAPAGTAPQVICAIGDRSCAVPNA